MAMASALVASDLYPIVRRFLLESGLARTLKAFDKETSAGEEETPARPSKKAKALAKAELAAACQLWLDSAGSCTNGVSVAATLEEEPLRPKKRKRSAEEVPAEEPVAVTSEEPEAEAPPTKKQKKNKQAVAEATEVPVAIKEQAAVEEPKTEVPEKKNKKKNKEQADSRTSGVPFKRVDDEKWRSTITDCRLIDNSHKAKQKFGKSAGDSWGDSAAVDMLKVKGAGFRKEMAKKKRASWRGSGELDQGVNSIKFADSSDDE